LEEALLVLGLARLTSSTAGIGVRAEERERERVTLVVDCTVDLDLDLDRALEPAFLAGLFFALEGDDYKVAIQ